MEHKNYGDFDGSQMHIRKTTDRRKRTGERRRTSMNEQKPPVDVKKLTACCMIILISVVLTVFCYTVLPDMLVVQLTVGGSEPTTVPKIIALSIPLALAVVCSVTYYKKRENDARSLIGALIGVALLVVTYVINRQV